MIPREEFEEAGLGADRALHTAGAKQLAAVQDLLEVEQEIMNPEANPLADRGGLRGLQVGAAETDQIAILHRTVGQPLDHHGQAGRDEIE